MDHFSIPLWVSSFSADPKKLVSELKSLKRTVRFYYNDVPARELWKNILQYRRKELPNLSLLVELVVSIAVNNSFVESIFSFLTAMLSDCRLCLRHETTANFLVIRANHLARSPAECEQLLDAAVKSFLMSRFKLKIAGTKCRSHSLAVAQGDTEGQPQVKMSKMDDPDQFDTNIEESESESDDDGTDDSESDDDMMSPTS